MLYKHTPMQTSFGVIMLALMDGAPKVLSLSQVLNAYVAHQINVVRRRTEYRLRKARDRAHIVEGLLRGPRHARRRSSPSSGARPTSTPPGPASWPRPFEFSEIQANHILDMPLRRLTGLERQKLHRRVRRAHGHDHRAGVDPGRRRQAPQRHQGRAHRDPRQVRQRPPQHHHLRPGRPRHPRPDRRRRVRGHPVEGRLHQDRGRRRLPAPGPRRPGRDRGEAAATRTTSSTCSPRPPTPTCCSSRPGAGSTGSGPTRSR